MARKRKRTPSAWRVERQLIGYVYEFPDITRSDLAKRLGQSPAAISLVIRRLITNGWLRESGRAVSLGGRRPVQLRLATGRAFIVGMDVGPDRMRAVLMDADGSVIERSEDATTPNTTPAEVLKQVTTVAKALTRRAKVKDDGLLGIGVALPGVVYAETGSARFTPGLFNWIPVDLVGELAEAFSDKLIAVDNDARARLNYEIYTNPAMRENTTFMVDVGYNVGAAITVKGVPYEGADGAPVDLARLIVRTPTGGMSTLEEFIGEPAILARVRAALATGLPSLLNEITSDPASISLEMLARASNAGDQLAFRVLTEVADTLGVALTLTVNLLRPRTLLFTGRLCDTGALLLDNVKRQLRLHALHDAHENVRLVVGESDDYAAALGAAHQVLRRWLKELAPTADGALQSV